MPLAAGTKLDSYEVLGLLGAGGMGEVYRARDSKLKREVAIKVLPSFVSRDRPAARSREGKVALTSSIRRHSAALGTKPWLVFIPTHDAFGHSLFACPSACVGDNSR
jgi:serine/threonine protein kinase